MLGEVSQGSQPKKGRSPHPAYTHGGLAVSNGYVSFNNRSLIMMWITQLNASRVFCVIARYLKNEKSKG
jgi:hypothetical protein